jgi:hypothetical protein
MKLPRAEGTDTSPHPSAQIKDIRSALIARATNERALAVAKYGPAHFPTSVLTAYENLTLENRQIIAAIGQSAHAAMGIEGLVIDNS